MAPGADELRYPIGPYKAALPATDARRATALAAIAQLPDRLRGAVADLTDPQLDTPYRPDGWTVRQVVHHVADSHINAYVRTKLALTAEGPTIVPYDENAWAALPDMAMPVDVSLRLLGDLHARWVAVCRAASPEQFARWFFHPGLGTRVSVEAVIHMYGWHSQHHVAHITELRRRKGW